MMKMTAIVFWLLNLLLALLLPGVINKTKAFFAGRRGLPWLQGYYDFWKLLHKGAVYSRTTSWVFRASPVIGLACLLTALALLPLNGGQALIHFAGDFILFCCLLALMRFFTVLAALDTGSSFEGMGASREVWIGALAEPALFLCLTGVAAATRQSSFSGMLSSSSAGWQQSAPALILLMASLFVIILAENARIPVDDPNTHLELTMVHEAMVLDHSGPDLGFILYGAALKFWSMAIVISGILLPLRFGGVWLDGLLLLLGPLFLGVVVGVVESVMARLRLARVPQLLVAASAFAILGLILLLR
ncbi:NADH-quinone oxidoreductase subunit H [candidate division FCPU426 bacterium]|nr:NADH-quinone oxidoreductase subunit H [candidate division FCPU426 bacterium]